PGHVHAEAAAGAVPGDRPASVVKPVSCEALPNVPGKSITTVTVDFPPGAYTPAHRHPGSVTAYVIKGAVRSQMAGGPPQVYGPGASWFEPPQALHLFAENASATAPARILAVFVADDNCGPLVIPER
ncbi:cupin domain-containing protein, partial [Inquilinus limosus]